MTPGDTGLTKPRKRQNNHFLDKFRKQFERELKSGALNPPQDPHPKRSKESQAGTAVDQVKDRLDRVSDILKRSFEVEKQQDTLNQNALKAQGELAKQQQQDEQHEVDLRTKKLKEMLELTKFRREESRKGEQHAADIQNKLKPDNEEKRKQEKHDFELGKVTINDDAFAVDVANALPGVPPTQTAPDTSIQKTRAEVDAKNQAIQNLAKFQQQKTPQTSLAEANTLRLQERARKQLQTLDRRENARRQQGTFKNIFHDLTFGLFGVSKAEVTSAREKLEKELGLVSVSRTNLAALRASDLAADQAREDAERFAAANLNVQSRQQIEFETIAWNRNFDVAKFLSRERQQDFANRLQRYHVAQTLGLNKASFQLSVARENRQRTIDELQQAGLQRREAQRVAQFQFEREMTLIREKREQQNTIRNWISSQKRLDISEERLELEKGKLRKEAAEDQLRTESIVNVVVEQGDELLANPNRFGIEVPGTSSIQQHFNFLWAPGPITHEGGSSDRGLMSAALVNARKMAAAEDEARIKMEQLSRGDIPESQKQQLRDRIRTLKKMSVQHREAIEEAARTYHKLPNHLSDKLVAQSIFPAARMMFSEGIGKTVGSGRGETITGQPTYDLTKITGQERKNLLDIQKGVEFYLLGLNDLAKVWTEAAAKQEAINERDRKEAEERWRRDLRNLHIK